MQKYTENIPEPGGSGISESDREEVICYAENRMDARQSKAFRQRMAEEPVLRKALSELIVQTRGTEYEKILAERNRTGTDFWTAIRRFLQEFPQQFPSAVFFRPMTAFAACLIAVLAVYALYFRTDTPVPVRIRFMTGPEKMIPDMRGEIRELADGGIVRSGEYFKLHVESEQPVSLIVLLHDSSGEITLLAEGKADAENPLPVSDGETGFQLDDQTGKETIYVIASEKAIPDLPQKIEQLRTQGIDRIQEVFREARVQTFTFEHR
ncbi:MAG: hypothetical protein AB7S75_15710 [Desulfococcaceae bacterium]